MSRKFRVKFPRPKTVIIWYLGNVTWQAHFLNLWKFHISCTFPGQVNMTFPAHFQWCQIFHTSCKIPSRTHEISCTFPAVSEISCVLHISKIKDIWHLLYISYTYPAVSEILHFMHISCDIRNFICRVHFHCQGYVTFTVHFLST